MRQARKGQPPETLRPHRKFKNFYFQTKPISLSQTLHHRQQFSAKPFHLINVFLSHPQNLRRLSHRRLMAFNHRKLLNESAHRSFCEFICQDFPTNPDRICLPPCEGFCPPDCKPVRFQFKLPLSPPPAPPPPPVPIHVLHRAHTLSLGLTISLAVLSTAFFLFTCFIVYRFYSYWRNSRARIASARRRPEEDGFGPDDFVDEEHGPIVDHPIWYIRTIGLQPSVISAITVVKYKRGDGLIEGTDCAVCLNEFEEDETLRLLPKCNHAFHIPCVDTWLRSHTNCPMCRAGIVNNTAAPLPSQESVVHNSGPVEPNQSEISVGDNREIGRESSEIDPPELGYVPVIEDDGILSRSQSGFKINEDGIIQPMRRSVSMDSSSASMISAAVARAFPRQSNRNSDTQLDESKDISQRDCCIKRSVSCSGEVLASRNSNSRSQNA